MNSSPDSHTVTELAQFTVRPGHEDAFIAANQEALHLIATTPGCHGVRLLRSQESPTRFIGLVTWESKQVHLDNFVATDRSEKYASLIAPHLAEPPQVEHLDAAG